MFFKISRNSFLTINDIEHAITIRGKKCLVLNSFLPFKLSENYYKQTLHKS